MSINFKAMKKPAVQATLKHVKKEAFVVAVVPCKYQKGTRNGEETGNFEIIVKTPQGKGTNDMMRDELQTHCLENYPSQYEPNWGGSHFRIETEKQYDLIVEVLRSLPFGDKLICEDLPANFKTKPAPLLKLHYDAPLEIYRLTEKAFPLKYFLIQVGFGWRILHVPMRGDTRPSRRRPGETGGESPYKVSSTPERTLPIHAQRPR